MLRLPWSVLALGSVAVAVLPAVVRIGSATASVGEARFAATVAGLRLGVPGGVELTLPERVAALQLAVLPVGGLPPVEAARLGCLVAVALTSLLLWPVLRTLGASPAAAWAGATATALAGALSVVSLGASAGAPAALWIVLAAAFAGIRARVPAFAVAVAAVATAPLAGAVLLALGAHLVLNGTVRAPARPRLLAAVLAGLALLVTAVVLATAEGARPPAVLVLAAGAAVVAVAAYAQPWLRPLLTPIVLLLAATALPTSAGAAAALLAVPCLAVVGALLLDTTERPARVAAVATVLVAGLAVATGPVAVPPAPGLAAWVLDELEPDAGLHADALDRVELLAAGFPAVRLRGAADPVAPGDVRLVTERPGGTTPECPPGQVLASTPRGSGGAPSAICPADAGGTPRAERARFGAELARNPRLRLGPGVADLLRTGAVDERIVAVLATIAGQRALRIDEIRPGRLDDPAVPRREVLLAAADGGADAGPQLHRWLAGQQPPFAPGRVQAVGSALLVTWYARPLLP